MMSKKTSWSKTCETHVCGEVLIGHSSLNVPCVDINHVNLRNMERSCINITTVGKPLVLLSAFGNNERTLTGEKPSLISRVGMLSILLVPSKDIKELILERSPMNVSNVGKPSLVTVPLKSIKEVTLEKNPMYVSSVGKL
jgi:hypothetical protein